VILVSDKWDTYVLDDGQTDEHNALFLLASRVDQGFWYPDPEDAARARSIADDKDGDAALRFLLERADHEYEYVEIK
jgi:hypothetical protein